MGFFSKGPAKKPLLDVCVELAQRATVSATRVAGPYVRTLRSKGYEVEPGAPMAILDQFMFYQMHWVERSATGLLQEPTLNLFLRTFMHTALFVHVQLQNPQLSESDCSEHATLMLADFDGVNERYARCNMADPKGGDLTAYLPFEFGAQVAEAAGFPGDQIASSSAWEVAPVLYHELQVEKHLAWIVQSPTSRE